MKLGQRPRSVETIFITATTDVDEPCSKYQNSQVDADRKNYHSAQGFFESPRSRLRAISVCNLEKSEKVRQFSSEYVLQRVLVKYETHLSSRIFDGRVKGGPNSSFESGKPLIQFSVSLFEILSSIGSPRLFFCCRSFTGFHLDTIPSLTSSLHRFKSQWRGEPPKQKLCLLYLISKGYRQGDCCPSVSKRKNQSTYS